MTNAAVPFSDSLHLRCVCRSLQIDTGRGNPAPGSDAPQSYGLIRRRVDALLSTSQFLVWSALSWTNSLFAGLIQSRRFTDNRFSTVKLPYVSANAMPVPGVSTFNPSMAFEVRLA